MKESILIKLEGLQDRYEELAALLSDPGVIGDQDKFRRYSQEYAELEPVVMAYRGFRQTQEDLEEAKMLLEDDDPDMRDMGKEELKSAESRQAEQEEELQKLLLPKDPNDSPGPSAPPPVTLFLVQDSAGVSAQLDDGTVIDIDANPDGTVDYAIDGATADVDEVAAELDAQLSDAEQAAMSEVLNATSVSDGTDELVDLLSE